MCAGPVAYMIFKPAFGGLYKKDPANNPLNMKTKMASRDTDRIAISFAIIGILFLIGRVFLPWYDDPAYYIEVYGNPHIFDTFMNVTLIGGIVCVVIAIAFYLIGKKVEKPENIIRA